MEFVIIVLIIVMFFVLKSTADSRFNTVDDQLNQIKKSIELLKKTTPAPDVQTATQTPTVIPTPKPVTEKTPEIIPDLPKPIPVQETPAPPKPQETAPKPVYQTFPEQRPLPVFTKPSAPKIPQKSWWENFKENNPDLEKFIGENLINKIGVLILVLGISYFVKFAIDKDWINEPARVGIGILCGALIMGFAHKLRKNYASFSSVLVAGAIAIFYFTIGIAFHDYQLFGQTTAFIIMVVITAFSAVISLSYNRKELAVLSLIGGFAVPFMVSTGQGNYAVLFTYIAILDIGILSLAYYKKWGIINILSYLFTVFLFGAWLIDDQTTSPNPHSASAIGFAFLFYSIFLLMNIVNNLRTKAAFSGIELSILVSNTFLFYAAGMVALTNYHPELKGLFTTFLALLNLVYAWFLYKKFGLDKTAVYLLIGLTLTFATLAVPIQFEGNYITLFWAAEAVLLMWLAQKSKIATYRFASVIVHFLTIISLILDWSNSYSGLENLPIAFNAAFLTGLFVIISFFAVIYLIKNENEELQQFGFSFSSKFYTATLLPVALILIYLTGFLEVKYQSDVNVFGRNSSLAFPALWHLIYSAGLFWYLLKVKTDTAVRGATVLAVANIILFTFWFSYFSIWEHENYITTGIVQRIAFYLHYLTLGLTIYFAYGLFQINKMRPDLKIFDNKLTFWITAFVLVYAASTELTLHSLVISNTPVSDNILQKTNVTPYNAYDAYNLKNSYAYGYISDVKDQVFRTGFPILWGVLAFIFLIIGIKFQQKTIRIIALTLLGLTIVKLFVFDIRNASETGKIIAFILLGVLILIISFVYNKLKVLVLSEKDQTPNDETE